MDSTSWGIALGLVVAAAHTMIRAFRQRVFDVGSAILMFLAGFSIPGGALLIKAGITGDPAALPTSWREHVAVAGVAAIGLAAHFIVLSLRRSWPRGIIAERAPITLALEGTGEGKREMPSSGTRG